MSGWLRGVAVVALALTAVGVGLVARAPREVWRAPSRPIRPLARVDVDEVAARLAAYVRVDTQLPAGPASWAMVAIEGPDGAVVDRPAWVDHLVRTWVEPAGLPWRMVAGALVVEVASPDARPPVLWLSHADVVAVADEEAAQWTHPPFAGRVADGFLWGRGALDNKASTVAQLEAVTALLAEGRAPSRDVVLLVTPDEEVDGATAREIAADHLGALGRPAAVIDEGSFVVPDLLPGALVGAVAVAEKRFVTYELVSHGRAGHASMPTGASAVDRLAAVVTRLSTWETEATLPAPMREGFRRLAPSRAFPESVVLGNPDLLEGILLPIVQRSPAGNAVTRDTVAVTVLRAGVKDNVVPAEARAWVNARLLPDTDPEAFRARLVARIADPEVEVRGEPWAARAGVSPWDTETFAALEAALAHVVPGVVVIPSLTPGSMDARSFSAAGLDAYRIHPFVVDAGERARLHGVDERLALSELERGVRFYHALLQVL